MQLNNQPNIDIITIPNLILYGYCQHIFDVLSRQLTLINEIKAHT